MSQGSSTTFDAADSMRQDRLIACLSRNAHGLGQRQVKHLSIILNMQWLYSMAYCHGSRNSGWPCLMFEPFGMRPLRQMASLNLTESAWGDRTACSEVIASFSSSHQGDQATIHRKASTRRPSHRAR
jgi:hypothetical protein